MNLSHAKGFPSVDRLIGALLHGLSLVDDTFVVGRICGWETHCWDAKGLKGRLGQEDRGTERSVTVSACTI